jgi:sulfur-oxidizing protein SoxY
MQKLNRRQVIVLAAGSAAALALGLPKSVLAGRDEAMAKVMEFTGGAEAAEGGVTLDMPEIAENGNTVPLTVSVDTPQTEGDHVQSVIVLAAGNPNPGVATFHFTPLSGDPAATTRMRLAGTQDVIAVAKMSDGSFRMTEAVVKVTIGGCGG